MDPAFLFRPSARLSFPKFTSGLSQGKAAYSLPAEIAPDSDADGG